MAESYIGEVPDDWAEMTLGQLCAVNGGGIQTGPFGSQLHASDYVSVGVPTVMPTNIGDNRIIEDGIARVSEQDAQRLARHRLQAGDIVCSRRGDVERRALVRDREVGWLCGTGSLRVRVGMGGVADPAFVSYWLGHPQIRAWITQHAVGATMANLNTEILSGVPVVVPPLHEQRSVAEVLGVLDDKIESNRRIVECAHGLATTEFKQWVMSVEQWHETTFGEFARVFGGATPRTDQAAFWDGPHLWATPTDVTRLSAPYLFKTSRQITDAGLAASSTELHPPGTVLMTSRATIGAFAVNQVPCATNQGFIAVHPARQAHRWYLLHEMVRRLPEMLDRANGTTFKEISRGSFKSMTVSVPADPSALEHLHTALDPLHQRAAAAASESDDLVHIRQALLPELLSGRLRVRDAEHVVAGVV